MKQPKRLTLQQAINATKNALARPGDLRWGQFFPQLIGHSDYPNGEMRGPFVPSHDFSVMTFPQPETENWLRELYAKGDWWLESATHLSDREIALLSDGRGGVMRPSGLVGDWGDAIELEQDLQDAFSLIPDGYAELPIKPVVYNIIRDVVLRLHKKYAPDADFGRAQSEGQARKARKGRYAKSDDDRTLEDVIRILSREHHNEKPSEVWTHLKTSLEEWSGDKVTESGAGDSRKYLYKRPNSADSNGGRTISYGAFRKKLSEIRDGKSGI